MSHNLHRIKIRCPSFCKAGKLSKKCSGICCIFYTQCNENQLYSIFATSRVYIGVQCRIAIWGMTSSSQGSHFFILVSASSLRVAGRLWYVRGRTDTLTDINSLLRQWCRQARAVSPCMRRKEIYIFVRVGSPSTFIATILAAKRRWGPIERSVSPVIFYANFWRCFNRKPNLKGTNYNWPS